MTANVIQFADFTLHPGERLLLKQSQPVELTSRYFDALLLLVQEPGTLISKERFMREVWAGIPVTDEALTQFGAASIMFVMIAITLLVALLGGAGVAFGLAAGEVFAEKHLPAGRRYPFVVLAAAFGGLLVGAFVKLVATDTFNLLLGASPGDITGAVEGFVLGGAVGLSYALTRLASPLRLALISLSIGGLLGALTVASGGNLLAGSLNLVALHVPASQLPNPFLSAQLELIAAVVEGALFVCACVVALAFVNRPPKFFR